MDLKIIRLFSAIQVALSCLIAILIGMSLWEGSFSSLQIPWIGVFTLVLITYGMEQLFVLRPLSTRMRRLRSLPLLTEQVKVQHSETELLDHLINTFVSQGSNVQKLSRIVDESSNAISLCDAEGKISYVNPSWMKINGYSADEVMGKTEAILRTEKTPEHIYRELDDAFRTGKRYLSRDFINRRKDGSEYFSSLSAFPILESGKVIAYATIQQDISREKEIDRMKTEFISMASHQLRTPLSAMRWFGELLLAGKGGELQPKQKEMVNNLQISTMRMIALVNALLDITRLESGRMIIEPEPTDLDELVRLLLVELTPRIEGKHLTLQSNIPQDTPVVNLDKKMIREVYVNLLTNAIKYTPEHGTITITITEDGETLLTSVQDTGLGIPAGEQDKVFSKFYRGSNVQLVETDGTGLGLYLVKAIIESSGGKIWFDSTEGKGTTFFFTIPKTGMIKKSGSVTIGS